MLNSFLTISNFLLYVYWTGICPTIVAMVFMPLSPTTLAQICLSNLISFSFTIFFVHIEVLHCFINFHSSRPLPMILHSTAVNPTHSSRKIQNKHYLLFKTFSDSPVQMDHYPFGLPQRDLL